MSDLIDVVKELYAAFGRGDIEPLIAAAADDINWEYEATSEIPIGGTRHSRKGVAEYFQDLAAPGTDQKLEMTEFFANEDAVAAFGRYQCIMKATGIRVDTPVAHYFKFRDGKISRFVQLSNTAAILEALRGRAAGAAS